MGRYSNNAKSILIYWLFIYRTRFIIDINRPMFISKIKDNKQLIIREEKDNRDNKIIKTIKTNKIIIIKKEKTIKSKEYKT